MRSAEGDRCSEVLIGTQTVEDREKKTDILFRTLELLEWSELCQRLSDRALSALGKQLCEALAPHRSLPLAQQSMALTSEMVDLIAMREEVPLAPFSDVTPPLEESERGKRLAGEALRQVGDFLVLVGKVRSFLQKRADRCPALWGLSSALQELDPLKREISQAIDSEGQVRDDASPRLGRLRMEARRSRKAVIERLEAFVKEKKATRVLQDGYYTIREGRFVLPVRADARSALDGIVHDISSTGSTYFLEPRWLVEMNNALRIAELAAEKEMERILEDLSCQVAQAAEAIRVDLDVVSQLDLVQAKARLARDLHASEPEAGDSDELVLRRLRHPLLALRKVEVVANDFILEPGDRTLVISGPNAGGKTVLLKALGLAALMGRAGLHIPADSGSRMPHFETVFADIGDLQDLHEDVSTFTGHMRNLREILESADDHSLVILDELAGSTDPHEGAALALAIMEALQEKKARCVISTHYRSVKAWAQGRPGFRNGAMEFDWERMEPTYRLCLGLPGRSSALEIARRTGIPDGVLDRADLYLKGEETDLTKLLRELEGKRLALEEEHRQASISRRRLQEAVSEEEDLVGRLRRELEDFARDKRKRLAEEIREARRKIRETMRVVAAVREREMEEARTAIREVEEGLKLPPLRRPAHARPLGRVSAGDRVEVLPLGQEGILLDDPDKKRGRVRVKVGSVEVLVGADSLGGANQESVLHGEKGGPSLVRSPHPPEVSPEIDLRGMRVEEALAALQSYLDSALLARRPEVRVIHGHGTGALKQAIREWLSGCDWVRDFRPGDRHEGGDGATMVRLRDRVDRS